MSLLRQPLERKLSAFIGAEVTFEKLKLSLLGGSLEASGIIVAGDDPAAPLLTIGRVRAEISVAKALAKQIVIKSLSIERPIISIVRRANGSTNLPRRQGIEASPKPDDSETSDDEGEAIAEPSNWRLATQKFVISEGAIQFRDETGASAYFASAEQISGDLRQDEDVVTVALEAKSVGRRDREVMLGPLMIQAKFTDVTDLKELAKSPVEATAQITGGIKLEANSSPNDPAEISLRLEGPMNLAELTAAAPPSARLPAALASSAFAGRANIALTAIANGLASVKISELVIRASEVNIPLREPE